MDKSAWRLALDMRDMVRLAGPQRSGISGVNLLASVLAAKRELANWKADAHQRCLAVADKLGAQRQRTLDKWELAF